MSKNFLSFEEITSWQGIIEIKKQMNEISKDMAILSYKMEIWKKDEEEWKECIYQYKILDHKLKALQEEYLAHMGMQVIVGFDNQLNSILGEYKDGEKRKTIKEFYDDFCKREVNKE